MSRPTRSEPRASEGGPLHGLGLAGSGVAVIGAGQGIGRATALLLARAGHRVVLFRKSVAACASYSDDSPGPTACH